MKMKINVAITRGRSKTENCGKIKIRGKTENPSNSRNKIQVREKCKVEN